MFLSSLQPDAAVRIRILIEMNKLPYDLITPDGGLAPELCGKVHHDSKESHPEPEIQFFISVLKIAPKIAFLGIILAGPADKKDRGCDSHDLIQVDHHIFADVLIKSAPVLHGENIDHDLVDTDLLIDPAQHYLLIDALVVSSDKVMIQVYIHVVELLTVRKRLECEDIGHVERMLGKLQAALYQYLMTVDDIVHQYVPCHPRK